MTATAAHVIDYLDCAAAGDLTPPDEPTDRGWHTLILDTTAYATLCAHRYGRFIHHIPDGAGRCGAR